MPFKSPKQEAWMWINKPEMAKKWHGEHGHAKGYGAYLKKRKKKRKSDKKSWYESFLKIAILYDDGYEYRILANGFNDNSKYVLVDRNKKPLLFTYLHPNTGKIFIVQHGTHGGEIYSFDSSTQFGGPFNTYLEAINWLIDKMGGFENVKIVPPTLRQELGLLNNDELV